MDSVRTARRVAWSRCGWLLAATAVLWLVLVGPAWHVGDREGLIGVSAAALLCLLPGLAVFWLATAFGAAGEQVQLVILGAAALRMAFVLMGMLVVQSFDRHLGFREFGVWLVAFYLGMLTVETFFGIAAIRSRNKSASNRPGQID